MTKLDLQCDLVTDERKKLVGLRLVVGSSSNASQQFCDALEKELLGGAGRIYIGNGQLVFALTTVKDSMVASNIITDRQTIDRITSVTFLLEPNEEVALHAMCNDEMGQIFSLRNGLPLYSGFEVFYFPPKDRTWYTRLRRGS